MLPLVLITYFMLLLSHRQEFFYCWSHQSTRTESDTDPVSFYALNSEQFPEEELPPYWSFFGRTGGRMCGAHGRGRTPSPVAVPRREKRLVVFAQRNSSFPFRNTPSTDCRESGLTSGNSKATGHTHFNRSTGQPKNPRNLFLFSGISTCYCHLQARTSTTKP